MPRSLPSASPPRQLGTLPFPDLLGLWITSVSPGPPSNWGFPALGPLWSNRAPPPTLHSGGPEKAPEATYSVSWSWGSARPRRRRSRGCGRRRCQSIRFLWEAQRWETHEVDSRPEGWGWGMRVRRVDTERALGDRWGQGRDSGSSGDPSKSPLQAPPSAFLWGVVAFPSGTGGTALTRTALTGTPGGRCYYDAHFPDEETESWGFCSSHSAGFGGD